MCNPISLIITEDKVFLPPDKVWNHSHTYIMKIHNIPDGMIGDKYLRLEITPPEENVFRNKETNKKLAVNKKWNVKVDETNIPDWYINDLANQENRAREAAKKWFKDFPDNLVPGYREITGDCANINAGDYSTLTGGDYSTLTGGIYSTLTAEYDSTLNSGIYSTLTGGDHSKLTAGYFSTLNAGNWSTLTGGDRSIFCAGENSLFSSTYWDGKRDRIVTFYVGENGILPNKKYKIVKGKIYDYETDEEVKTDKTLKKKAKKNK